MELKHCDEDPSSFTRWWGKETTSIVTGANRGIGFALAKRLAELGVTVILTARDESKGVQAMELLKSQGLGDYIHFSPLDISQPQSITAFASWFKHKFGVLDILVNNAAVSFNGIHENSVQHAETVINTNYHGPKLLIQALLPFFRCSSSKSRILNLTSRLGLTSNVRNPKTKATLEDVENLSEQVIEEVVNSFLKHVKEGVWENEGWPEHWTDYSVSKLALNAYSKILAKELENCNITVNCFCPGFTQTGMTGGKGSRTADIAANVAAKLALLPPHYLPTGRFVAGQSMELRSRF
ncbi:(+)-neomenthol dehydrogenase isoform X2 [Silene latifolia]|uniref:(+)-neomenthol dehydrogenase isoform X2 n=1 Tax=Silene latifolia TaxID=37657 RepID=UPI003D77C267